ncbi:hypothetical protein DTO164E3_2398 [Paecilomyces variotii]|nr:hypothetical protein DTO164E3_2398 [Paecilomyces variotii]KAJ9206817.1 hypothetical protein DTO032I3_1405 [Paecilomyces variotii]KAJ9274398.1 hypothetical protein DTO021D3_8762 [Paecilomyces variotii]KAJ9290347.1 hypothetical protein DTO021C3_1971 [Paecilomyces variotii]KAJ9346589.1 hypothetical protein DTO027B6_843 [Paecilomyces variotii]
MSYSIYDSTQQLTSVMAIAIISLNTIGSDPLPASTWPNCTKQAKADTTAKRSVCMSSIPLKETGVTGLTGQTRG